MAEQMVTRLTKVEKNKITVITAAGNAIKD
jgi:hypothetical protein